MHTVIMPFCGHCPASSRTCSAPAGDNHARLTRLQHYCLWNATFAMHHTMARNILVDFCKCLRALSQRASSPSQALAPSVRTCASCPYCAGSDSILRAKYISPWDCLKSHPALLVSSRAQLQALSCSCGRSSPGKCPLAQNNTTTPQAQPPAPWKLRETNYTVVLCYVWRAELAPLAKVCLFPGEALQQK